MTSATLEISTGIYTVVYLNGNRVMDEDPLMSPGRGHSIHSFTSKELCWFSTSNTLSFDLEETIQFLPLKDMKLLTTKSDRIGLAYVLTVLFSDGTKMIITSSEAGKTLNYHSTAQPKSAFWAFANFNDKAWLPANLIQDSVFTSAKLPDPIAPPLALFASAWKVDEKLASHIGEAWLFRRDFPLTVGIRPECAGPKDDASSTRPTTP